MENEYLDNLNDALNSSSSQKSDAEMYTDKLETLLGDVTSGNRDALSVDKDYLPADMGFGESRYDDMTLTQAQFEGFGNDVNEMRAQRQPWLDKAGAGLVKIGAKVISEVAKMPGMLGGIIAAPASDNPWKTAFDNSWISTIEEWNEHVNSEYLPVYVKKAVSEGNLWDNISSIDFWANEGADGIGFIASMYVPGLALSKVGAGSKIVRGLSKAGTKMLGSHENALQAMKQLGITGKNIDVFNATMANTLFEAGSEAGHAMRSFEEQLNAQYKAGDITEDEFNERMKKAPELARNVFTANMGILLGPNLISNKILLGKTGSGLTTQSFLKKGSKELLDQVAHVPNKKKALGLLKEYGKGFLREGFFEEGLQSTAENYFSAQAREGKDADMGSFLGSLGESYLDMVSSTDGQKAIFLGGFLGGPMNVYNKFKTDKADSNRKNHLLSAMNNSLDTFSVSLTDIYQKNEDGTYVLDKEGNRVKDPNKVNKVLSTVNQIEDMNHMLEAAELTGNQTMADAIRSQMISSMAVPFVSQGDVGIDLLKQQLEGMTEIKDNVEKYNDAYGANLTQSSFVSDIVAQAREMQKDYEMYDTYGRDLIDLKNKDASPAEKEHFYNVLRDNYLLTRARRKYMQNYKEGLISEKQRLDSEYESFWTGNNAALDPENAENIKMTKPVYKNVVDRIAQVDDLLGDLVKQEESFWDTEAANSEFNKLVKVRKAHDKKQENKEEEKATTATEEIANASNEKEVDEAVNKTADVSKETAAIVKNAAETKKDQLLEEEENQAAEQVNKIKEEEAEQVAQDWKSGDEVVIDGISHVINVNGENDYSLFSTQGGLDEGHFNITKEQLAELAGVTTAKAITELASPGSEAIAPDSTEGGEQSKRANNVNIHESTNYFNNEGETYQKNLKAPSEEDVLNRDITREHVKVIGVDSVGNKLPFLSDTVVDYLRNGENKVGKTVTFELGVPHNEAAREAIATFESLGDDVKTRDDLMKAGPVHEIADMLFNLPIKVNLSQGVSSFLTTVPKGASKLATDIFMENELPLRTDIILGALQKGKDLSAVSSTIQFQYPGRIKKAAKVNGQIPENNLMDLNHVNDINDIELMFSADNTGSLYNENKDLVDDLFIGAHSTKGFVYTRVPMANGRVFPMKLNVSKVNENEAETLFRIIGEVFNNVPLDGFINQLSDDTQKILKEQFDTELGLFNKPYKDIRIYDFIDLLVYDNPNSNYKFKIENGSLSYGAKTANKNSYINFKDSIVKWLQSEKRRHIDVAALAGTKDIDPAKYKAYLVGKRILNTDSVVNEPLFQGNTNVYISKDIEVGKVSENKAENILTSPENIVSLQETEENTNNIEDSVENGFDFMNDAIEQNKDIDNTDDYNFYTKC